MAFNYYNFLDKILNYKSKIKYFEIDFNKPWLTETILRKPFLLFISIISEILQAAFLTVSPVIIGYIFTNRKYEYLWLFFGIYVFLELTNRFVWYIQNYIIEINRGSLLIAANKYLLATDPINHTFRSSGEVISKIEKSTDGLKQFFFITIDDFVPTATSIIALIITFLSVDRFLGILCLMFLAIVGSLNIAMSFYNGKTLKPLIIKAEDNITKTYTEGLIFVSFIRSTFSTASFFSKVKRTELENGTVTSTAHMGYGIASAITRILFATSYLILGLLILKMINNNQLDFAIGSGIFISYIAQMGTIRSLGSLTKEILEKNLRLKDFFKFMREFGKQTYPVLED